jgi:hypothetical protein
VLTVLPAIRRDQRSTAGAAEDDEVGTDIARGLEDHVPSVAVRHDRVGALVTQPSASAASHRVVSPIDSGLTRTV